MSTRGLYTFFDDQDSYSVYKHCDNYPSGALESMQASFALSWVLPRFEADEFACAFIAANKEVGKDYTPEQRARYLRPGSHGGGLRLCHDGRPIDVAPPDIEYRYELRAMDGKLWIKAFSTDYWDEIRTESELFSGTLGDFALWIEREKVE